MINLIVWLIVGGLIGWVASMIMRTNAQQGILMNVVVGIVGAFLAGFSSARFLGLVRLTIATSVSQPCWCRSAAL